MSGDFIGDRHCTTHHACPCLQRKASALDALLGDLEKEVERLREVSDDCAEAAREFLDTTHSEKALLQSSEAGAEADRLTALLNQYRGDGS